SWHPGAAKPLLTAEDPVSLTVAHPNLMPLRLVCDGAAELLFCDNESNAHRLWGMERAGFPKDAINDYIVGGDVAAVNRAGTGTKAAAHCRFAVPAGGQVCIRLRLAGDGGGLADFDAILRRRLAEADEFYEAVHGSITNREARSVQRAASGVCRHA